MPSVWTSRLKFDPRGGRAVSVGEQSAALFISFLYIYIFFMYTRYIYIYIFKSMNTNEHRERILPGGAGPLAGWLIHVQPHLSITRRAVFHPVRCHFARMTSGKSRSVPIRPRYERICTKKHTDRQWAPSKIDLERPQWRVRCGALPLLSGWETVNKIAGEGSVPYARY